MARRDKSIETESRLELSGWVEGSLVGGVWRVTANRHRISCWGDKSVIEVMGEMVVWP
jgi:hypothetical protein